MNTVTDHRPKMKDGTMPSNPEPSQPLTDELSIEEQNQMIWDLETKLSAAQDELARLRPERDDLAARLSARVVIEQTISELQDDVDRLRAENTAVKTQRDQFQKMMNSTVSAGVTIDGERLDALRERDALQGQLDKARKALFDDAFEGHAHRYRALAHALGVDQSEEGQTDA
jgi:predicted RNase H-like nuclease (RuvC/YqgF family)